MASTDNFTNYNRKLLSILEVLGSYFVDVYYNHVYNAARAHLKSGGSLTDAYVDHVKSYIQGVKTDAECYRDVILNLHKYFQNTTKFRTCSFVQFVDKIVIEFMPEEYFDLLKTPEKDESLASIVADLVSALGAYATSPEMIRRIIDEHDSGHSTTIRMMQDMSITALLAKRGTFHNNFLRRIGQTKDTVSMDIVNNLKGTIRTLVRDKSELNQENEKLRSLISEYKQREAKFTTLVKMLQKERTEGKTAVAFSSRIPEQSSIAEFDSLAFTKRPPEIPAPDSLAEGSPKANALPLSASPAPPAVKPKLGSMIVESPAKERRLTGDITTLVSDEKPTGHEKAGNEGLVADEDIMDTLLQEVGDR